MPNELLNTRSYLIVLAAFLSGCESGGRDVTYVCEEPLDGYLEQARANIVNDYEVERSRELLAACPELGYHRLYRFEFESSALLANQAVPATVIAKWCNEPEPRVVEAELNVSTGEFTFRFLYPWATSTGKYPQTEFRLQRNRMRGGFFDDLRWRCRVETEGAED